MTSGAVLFAKDVDRVARFYEDLIAFTRVVSEPDLVVLESATAQLVIHGIPKAIAKGIRITSPPQRRTEVPVKLFFPVPSLAAARERCAALGGVLDTVDREWEARGFRACDGHDPEGNVLQLREAA